MNCRLNKRPLVGMVVCFVIGIAWRITNQWLLPCGIATFVIYCECCGRMRRACHKNYCRILAVSCLLAFLTGAMRYEWSSRIKQVYQPYLTDGTKAGLSGTIWKKEEKNEQYLIYLKRTSLQINQKIYRTGLVLVYLSEDSYPIGTTLHIKGNIKEFRRAVNEGSYDEKAYYSGKNIDYAFNAKQVLAVTGKKSAVKEGLYQLRKRLRKSICENTKEQTAGILSVMTLGEKSMLDKETKVQYQRAGISHVLVISGLHISLLGMGVYGLLRRCKRGIGISAIFSVAFLLAYGCMVGSGTSTERAVIMFVVAMGGRMLGRVYDGATALALSAGILIWQNPYLLLDAGFQFSAAAVLGVLLTGVFWNENQKIKGWQVNICILIMTLPLVMFYYYEVPAYSLILNLLVLPLLTPVVALGLIGAVIGMEISKASQLVLLIPQLLLKLVSFACDRMSSLPYAQIITGKPGEINLLIYYLTLLIVIWMRMRRAVNADKTKERKRNYKSVVAKLVKNGALLAILYCVLIIKPSSGTRIDILDVGQGDGICIQTGGKTTMLIDGGSSNVSGVGTYRIEPYLKYHGIRKVDAWFVSHPDSDHISGVFEVLENGYPVSNLILGMAVRQNPQVKRLLLLAEQSGTRVLYWEQGSSLQLKKGSMTCVFPGRHDKTDDTNGNSLVLLYEEENFRALFTGDTTAEQEQKMLVRQVTGQVDFYKAAHHGSNYSNSKEWLLHLSPKITVVSCGAKNSYGHPGREAVERMKEAGSQIYYTMTGGQITIEVLEKKIRVKEYMRTS